MYSTTLTLITDQDSSKILLGTHTRGIGKGKVNAPGGKVEIGETLRQSACREIAEETGIKLIPEQLKKAGYIRFVFDDPSKDHDCTVYSAQTDQKEIRQSEEFPCSWYPITTIPYDLMWEGDSIWFADMLTHNAPTEWMLKYDGDSLIRHEKKGLLTTKFILVRHGWSQSNELGIYDSDGKLGLTDKGHKQAIKLAQKLQQVDIDAIYGSPFLRCTQTIQPTVDLHGLPYQQSQKLKEISFGEDSGHPYRPEYKHKRLQDHDFSHEGGESFSQVLARCQSFVDGIQQEHTGEIILACTHGNPGRALHYILSDKDQTYLEPIFEFAQATPKIFEKDW